jgi:hypothetical protein
MNLQFILEKQTTERLRQHHTAQKLLSRKKAAQIEIFILLL